MLAWRHQGPHCLFSPEESGQAPRWPLPDAWAGSSTAKPLLLGKVVTQVMGCTRTMKSGHLLNRQHGLGVLGRHIWTQGSLENSSSDLSPAEVKSPILTYIVTSTKLWASLSPSANKRS